MNSKYMLTLCTFTLVSFVSLSGMETDKSDLNRQLINAARNGYTDLVQELLVQGADIEAQDICGMTPLLTAASNGYTGLVKELLAQGADIEAQDICGMTPLQNAASIGYTDLVKELLAQGADIEARNDYGWTPLLTAACYNYTDLVKELLAQGADYNTVRKKDDKTVYDLASPEIQKIIRAHAFLTEGKNDSSYLAQLLPPLRDVIGNMLAPHHLQQLNGNENVPGNSLEND